MEMLFKQYQRGGYVMGAEFYAGLPQDCISMYIYLVHQLEYLAAQAAGYMTRGGRLHITGISTAGRMLEEERERIYIYIYICSTYSRLVNTTINNNKIVVHTLHGPHFFASIRDLPSLTSKLLGRVIGWARDNSTMAQRDCLLDDRNSAAWYVLWNLRFGDGKMMWLIRALQM